MCTAPPPLKCDSGKKTETNWMKIGTKTTLDHRVCLHRVSETFRKLQKFSKGSTRKQNRQKSHSLISAGVRVLQKRTFYAVQQVPNPPSKRDEPFYAHHNQFLNDGYYMIEL